MDELLICPNCGSENPLPAGADQMKRQAARAGFSWTYGEMCLKCGAKVSKDDLATYAFLREKFINIVSNSGNWASVPEFVVKKLNEEAQSIILTTIETIPDQEILSAIDVVTAECVQGTSVFQDLESSFSDLTGDRSLGLETGLRDAKSFCMSLLRRNALVLGADAVVGVRLDFSEISGGGRLMLFLVASGTAVRIKK